MKRRFLVVAFTTGFALMVFEMVAARIMSPFVGNSIFVWTSIIGVIVAALSLGYWFGGAIADKRKSESDIAWLLIASSVMVVITLMQYSAVLGWLVGTDMDIRLQATTGAILLFAPTSFILGAVSPYLVKFQVSSLAKTGRSVASLSAVNSIGGIAGTFLAGFFLFGVIGSRETMVIIAILLASSSWLVLPKHRLKLRLVLTSVMVLASLSLLFVRENPSNLTIDTASAHYTIREYRDLSGRLARGLLSGNGGTQSAIYLDSPDELVFWYTRQMSQVVEQIPDKDHILVIGGGTFTMPEYFARKYPNSKITVVEIDPELVNIAREYFDYDDLANVQIVAEDARVFLANSTEKYDVILVDAYNDSNIPFSLVTREYAEALRDNLKATSVVIANVIGSETGACKSLLEIVNAPYYQLLGEGQFFANDRTQKATNIIAVYGSKDNLDSYNTISFDSLSPLSDNFAPTEHIRERCGA